MSEVIFRLAEEADKTAIFAFMDTYWGSRHPLLHEPAFFHYYFETGNGLNFALALADGKPEALCGFTPCNRAKTQIWVSLWLAAPKKNGVGLELMSRMGELTGAGLVCCNNIRENTIPLYHFLGYTAEELPQYYRLRKEGPYRIAEVTDGERLPVDTGVLYREIDLADWEDKLTFPADVLPQKDYWYLHRRYLEFPLYQYRFYGREEAGRLTSLLVVRENPVEDGCVLRLVDYLGSDAAFGEIGGTLDALLEQAGAEYIDCYVYGLPEEALRRAGLTRRTRGDKNCIPNYLNPLLRENIDYFFFTSDAAHFRMFKADGDQDRPNLG